MSVELITVEDILTTCGKHKERLQYVTSEIRENATDLQVRLNVLFALYGKRQTLTSGFRDRASNLAAGGREHSCHMRGCAADIEDRDKKLTAFVTKEILVSCGLYAEDPRYTASWLHVQSEAPKSGRRIFIP